MRNDFYESIAIKWREWNKIEGSKPKIDHRKKRPKLNNEVIPIEEFNGWSSEEFSVDHEDEDS